MPSSVLKKQGIPKQRRAPCRCAHGRVRVSLEAWFVIRSDWKGASTCYVLCHGKYKWASAFNYLQLSLYIGVNKVKCINFKKATIQKAFLPPLSLVPSLSLAPSFTLSPSLQVRARSLSLLRARSPPRTAVGPNACGASDVGPCNGSTR